MTLVTAATSTRCPSGWAVLATFLVLTALGGCGGGDSERFPLQQPVEINEATSFAGFVLPPSAQLVGAHQMNGMDHLVAFAVRLPPEEVDDLLASAGFTEPLRPGYRSFTNPVKGVDLEAAKSFAGEQDEHLVNGERIYRKVQVVTDDPAVTLVHVWAFTT